LRCALAHGGKIRVASAPPAREAAVPLAEARSIPRPFQRENPAMARPIVYGPAGSNYVWSVRLALAEKGVTHELVEVAFGAHREMPHLARHPFAKVPALEHDGFAIYETQAILRYVDERFRGVALQPEDVFEFSRMNQLMGIVDAYAQPSIAGTILYQRLLVPRQGGSADEAAIAAAMPQARLCLAEMDRLMADNRFLAGAYVSLADLMVAPLLHYLGNVPDGRPLLVAHPKLEDWRKRIAERQSFQVTKPPGA
jgi:glutathione S-transferase